MSILILDNYDSFVYNLYQRIGEISGIEATVLRNDATTLDEVRALAPSHIVISPGPGNPDDPKTFGICRDVIVSLGPTTPTLGVCLGHQGLTSAFGGTITRAPSVMHGKTSLVHHDGRGLLAGLPRPFVAMRYHSLTLAPDSIPDTFEITAQTDCGVVMAVQHRRFPIHGVQFHPESIGTPDGPRLLANFLAL